jgi:hypothetical protein
MAALAIANEVRFWRKVTKADLKAQRVLLAKVLLSDANHLQGMKIRDLLLATPGLGKRKADRAMRACRMSESARVLGITPRRRKDLLNYLARNHRSIEIGWEVKGG